MDSLSVVIPAHDDAATVGAAIRSVERAAAHLRRRAGGGAPPVEVVVVDDGSADETFDAARAARCEGVPVRVARRVAAGSPGCARNRGAALASGSILCFLDADDVYLEPHLWECWRALEDPAVGWAKTAVALSDPVHPDWRARIGNSLVINLAVRRRCHEFVGGFLDYHLFRRDGDAFLPELDVFTHIEDVHYNGLLARFFPRVEVAVETARYVRRTGNSFDRQYAKFQAAPGAFPEKLDPELDFRIRLGRLLAERHAARLAASRGP